MFFKCKVFLVISIQTLLITNVYPNTITYKSTYLETQFANYNWHDWLISGSVSFYFSRYPKLLGAGFVGTLLTSPFNQKNDGGEYTLLPPAIYNFLLPSDVGDEGRFRVFATNIGLMVAGHYTYEWFIKDKSPTPKDPNALTWTPLLSTEFQGIMVSRRF
jgi:hypothetical protein